MNNPIADMLLSQAVLIGFVISLLVVPQVIAAFFLTRRRKPCSTFVPTTSHARFWSA